MDNVQKQLEYHKTGNTLIEQAISCEEKSGSETQAISLYWQGISELEKALRLEYKSYEWNNVKDQHEKIMKTKEMAEDRVNQLMNKRSSGSNNPPTSSVKQQPQSQPQQPQANINRSSFQVNSSNSTNSLRRTSTPPTQNPIPRSNSFQQPSTQPSTQPQQGQQNQQNQQNPFALYGAIASLWAENLTNRGSVTNTQQRQQEVNSHLREAHSLINQVGGPNPDEDPELGLPTSLQGWANLAIEAALLPKPELLTQEKLAQFSQGQNNPQTNFRNSNPNPNPSPNSNSNSNPSASKTPNTFFSNPTNQQQNLGNFGNLKLKNLEFTKFALAREPQKKWLQINWHTPEEGAKLAKLYQKPMFLEIVVGRLGNTSSAVC